MGRATLGVSILVPLAAILLGSFMSPMFSARYRTGKETSAQSSKDSGVEHLTQPGGMPQPPPPGGMMPQPPPPGGMMPQPPPPGGMMPQPGHPGMMPQPGHPGMMPQPGHPGMMPQPGHPGMMPQPGHPGGMMPQPGYPGGMPVHPGMNPHQQMGYANLAGSAGVGGKLLPALAQAPTRLRYAIQERITAADIMTAGDSNEYTILMQNYGPVLRFRGNWASSMFGYRKITAYDMMNQELFMIRDTHHAFNPFKKRWSFRVLAPGRDSGNEDVLFTINKDYFGRGLFLKKAEWRIYKGLERHGQMLYYCVGSYWGWDHRCYHSREDYDMGRRSLTIHGTAGQKLPPVAHLTQEANAGAIYGGDIGNMMPDKFFIDVQPGEDAALLNVFGALVDVVNDAAGSDGVVEVNHHQPHHGHMHQMHGRY